MTDDYYFCHLKAAYSFIKAIYVRVPTYSCILPYFETISVVSFTLESIFRLTFSCEFHAKVETSNLHNCEILVFGSTARVLKPSGRTILFYDKMILK